MLTRIDVESTLSWFSSERFVLILVLVLVLVLISEKVPEDERRSHRPASFPGCIAMDNGFHQN